MATFVLVHGAFGGGWEWEAVASALRRRGHEAFTPTLTGLGDRAHLARPDVGLATHIDDLVEFVHEERLEGVFLSAASYGGMPATGAAARLGARLRGLLYVDALVPQDGESALDLLPASFGRDVRERLESGAGTGWKVPVPRQVLPPKEGLSEAEWDAYVRRLVPQPAKTFLEPLHLEGPLTLPRAFLRCTDRPLPGDPIAPMVERARRSRWPVQEIATPHDPQLFAPAATAEAIVVLTEQLATAPP